MPLTDPELDLLREMLEDDPTDDVFLQVGEELVRRGDHEGAAAVLRAGLAAHPEEVDGWRHLTRAALECGAFDEALSAWDQAGEEHRADPDFARLRILVLERAGRIEEARDAVEAFEAQFDGHDVVVEAAKERMEAPPASDRLSAHDPFLTVRLAERYAAIGREDRAIRVYRRILFRHPGDIAIKARLEQLDRGATQLDDFTDLSEELADPNLVPPVFEMPMPGITSASVKPAPSRDLQPPAAMRHPHADLPTPAVDELEGVTYTAPAAPEELEDAVIEVEDDPVVERKSRFPPPPPVTLSPDEDAPTEELPRHRATSDSEQVTEIDEPIDLGHLSPVTRKKIPKALEAFMADAREAERRATEAADDDDEELEELPGLADMGMARTRKPRKKRRSLLKR